MNKTKNIQNKTKTKKYFITASIAIVVALALLASPIVTMDDAFATKKKYKAGNVAQQSISQSQSSVQNALCASGATTFLSCNNVSFQNQKNSGNNALVQQDDDDDDGKGGNYAEQSISQSQSSSQNSQVVSGGDTIGSGNNINVQNQENSGNNAAAQS
jgi:ABC-type Na+ efflux pump permease subunit